MIEKPSLYVCSSSGFCGKSIISLALALIFRKKGYNIGYFKPIGWEMRRSQQLEKIDEDAELMASVLDLPMKSIVPVILSTKFLEEMEKTDVTLSEEKVLREYRKVTEDKDIIILEGPQSLDVGSSMSIDPISFSKKIESPVLMVSGFQNEATIDCATWSRKVIDAFGASLLGLIVNRVPKIDLEKIRRFAQPVFKKNRIELLGLMPEIAELMALTVREICSAVKGEVLTAEDRLNNLVEDILIGAMSPQSSLSYFRRSFRKAVITGGDRTDIQAAALETDLSTLILTGNLYPDARILARAEELRVPVLLAPQDTYSTVRRISSITGRIHPKDERKITLAKKLVEENVDWERILDHLIQ